MNHMLTTTTMLSLFLVASPIAAADGGNSCDWSNTGWIVVVNGDIDGNECNYEEGDVTYIQFCDQGSGAGAGFVAVPVNGGDSDAGDVGAGASTACNMNAQAEP